MNYAITVDVPIEKYKLWREFCRERGILPAGKNATIRRENSRIFLEGIEEMMNEV